MHIDFVKHMKTYHNLSLENQKLFINYSKEKQQIINEENTDLEQSTDE